MTIYYAGIGSRKTPEESLEQIRVIAYVLAQSGFVLRSGGAKGADTAFERGCDLAGGEKQIFLPWNGFEGKKSSDKGIYSEISPLALEIASKIHPTWNRLSQGAQKLHARNCHQILGPDLETPVHFVVCWTPGTGGTEQALRLARQRAIPIINLAKVKGETTLLSVFRTIGGPIMNSRPAWMEVGDENWDNVLIQKD